MIRWKYFFVVLALVTLPVGCSTTNARYDTQHATRVDLTKANYTVIKAGAVGKSYGFRLLGIPLFSPSYVKAMTDLRLEAPMEGKSTTVANVVQEESSVWLLLFSIPKITITGDIIEFTDTKEGAGVTQ